ncbi:exopolysaccharide biosynthesis GT4 family glycosyltransferase EpsE [Rubellimicrobium aerolatum]|uniref:Exopolysaccharide biosynthesis GT4 family glycosyltransferase EpsE n=1 Tax=Rubellimicrobium aerolatum TaxID=490979 RepID=A0ABW0SFR3_9RHOB|nr:exopolysaccharide biosynthesis GT4 family glycosyltransferase EpsE [Rubellimicrobium aerolatum]MBP1806384.1 glycosyltransferase involved in cell wall biosynthesis [Rubellimicrobium aerolatum]
MPAIRPRIGYLVPCFPGPTHPAVRREVAALEAQGVEVVLLSDRPPPPALRVHGWCAEAMARTTYLARGLHRGLGALAGLPWAELRGAERGFARDLLGALGPARALVEAAARLGLRHVHVQSSGRVALVAALAERLGGPSYSLALHGPLSEDGPGQNLKWRAARFATVASRRLLAEVKTVLREDRPARLVVQPLGVDAGCFGPLPYAPPAPGEPLRLLACGRLEESRGLAELLLALRRLLDRGVPATLRIAGPDGAEGRNARPGLERRMRGLRLGERAVLTGPLGEERMREEMRAAHAFVRPNPREGLSAALMEAMACGLPVVAAATGGVRELVTHGVDGILVPPRDPGALAGALDALARSPARARALSEAARARVEAGFDAGRGAATLMRELGLRPWEEVEHDLPPLPLAMGTGLSGSAALR